MSEWAAWLLTRMEAVRDGEARGTGITPDDPENATAISAWFERVYSEFQNAARELADVAGGPFIVVGPYQAKTTGSSASPLG